MPRSMPMTVPSFSSVLASLPCARRVHRARPSTAQQQGGTACPHPCPSRPHDGSHAALLHYCCREQSQAESSAAPRPDCASLGVDGVCAAPCPKAVARLQLESLHATHPLLQIVMFAAWLLAAAPVLARSTASPGDRASFCVLLTEGAQLNVPKHAWTLAGCGGQRGERRGLTN